MRTSSSPASWTPREGSLRNPPSFYTRLGTQLASSPRTDGRRQSGAGRRTSRPSRPQPLLGGRRSGQGHMVLPAGKDRAERTRPRVARDSPGDHRGVSRVRLPQASAGGQCADGRAGEIISGCDGCCRSTSCPGALHAEASAQSDPEDPERRARASRPRKGLHDARAAARRF